MEVIYMVMRMVAELFVLALGTALGIYAFMRFFPHPAGTP